MTIVLTNCTNRKSGIANPLLICENLDTSTIGNVAQQWVNRLKEVPPVNSASNTYCGRGFQEAKSSANSLNCPLYVVSAGLGIIKSTQLIPSYNLTISSRSNNSINRKVTDFTSTDKWWSCIANKTIYGSSLFNTLKDQSEGLILIALSRPYIELINDELLNFPPHQEPRVRFFGKKLNHVLPEYLHKNWMPYDDRLDSTGASYKGTQGDFAQRALRHFVNEILSNEPYEDTHSHSTKINALLAPLSKRETPKRQQMNDQEIANMIRNQWELGKGQSSRILRLIRHELGIACEQSRFKKIYHFVKNTSSTAL
jgi:hypothetical protein